MFNSLACARQISAPPPMTLNAMWHVDADERYDVRRRSSAQSPEYVAIRTLGGVGEICLTDGRSCALPQGSLFVAARSRIARYFCKHDRWHFFWFEFDCGDRTALPGEQVCEIPVQPGEETALSKCFDALNGSVHGETARLAQALFQYLMADWLCRRAVRKSRAVMNADELALLLARGMQKGLSVAELAREACMCERSFRDLVKKQTGKGPREYMLHYALDTAFALIQTTDLSIAEISAGVGFRNAFHFSRMFKNRFGIQPSQARRFQKGGSGADFT